MSPLKGSFPPLVHDIAQRFHQAGGRAVLVGGCVRDLLMGRSADDFDIEAYGLNFEDLRTLLSEFGNVIETGKAFGVLKIKGTNIDVAIPRLDNKIGKGHRGFKIVQDPDLTFEQASSRRDLTINSMGFDPLTEELLDPHGGAKDLEQKRLHPTSLLHFAEDPLRGLRAAQFAARFEMTPTDELLSVCKTLDLNELAPERIYQEFAKLLLKSNKPSIGFHFLDNANLIRFFPQIEHLKGTPQSKEYHPEGDVWIHTLMVLDQAAKLRTGNATDDLVLMFSALCHDFGKPLVTKKDETGRLRAIGHEHAGVLPTKLFLEKLQASKDLSIKVSALVDQHLCPLIYTKNKAKDGTYRKLARTLFAAKTSMEMLSKLARADHLGRTTTEALAGQCPDVDAFIQKCAELDILCAPTPAVVQGGDLIEQGLKPGPKFNVLLKKALHYQDETGSLDKQEILKKILGDRG